MRAASGINNSGQRLRGVAVPTAADDAATKGYVDGLLGTKDVTGFRAGRWYTPLNMAGPVAGAAQTANTIVLVPVQVKRAMVLAQLAANLTTGISGSQAQFLVYAHSFVANGPGALLAASEQIVSSGTTPLQSSQLPQTNIPEGFVWMGLAFSAAIVVLGGQFNQPHIFALLGNTGSTVPLGTGNGSQVAALLYSATFGSPPADLSSVTPTFTFGTRAPYLSMLAGADS